MQPTILKPQEQRRAPSTTPRQIKAARRSPTLLRTGAAGSPGLVQSWAPDRWRLWVPVLRGEMGAAILAGLLFWSLPMAALAMATGEVTGFMVGWVLIPLLGTAIVLLPGLLRPCRLAADNNGIAFTNWGGTCHLQWSEIRTLEKGLFGAYEIGMAIRLAQEPGSGSRVIVDLGGYSRRNREEILSLIIDRADLHPHPFYRSLFLCPDGRRAG